MSEIITVTEGTGPVVLAQPHGGTQVPDPLWQRLNPRGQRLEDTDWHIAQLYDGLLPWATVVRANIHRYVIDVNRDPGGVSLYPGQNTSGLCPLTDFDGDPIWLNGQAPAADEIAERRDTYHAPDHRALQAQLDRRGSGPASGVWRHADADYEAAVACAREKGLRLPIVLGN